MQRLSAKASLTQTEIAASGEFTTYHKTSGVTIGLLTGVPVDTQALVAVFSQGPASFTQVLPSEYVFILHDVPQQATYFGVDFFASKPMYYAFLKNDLLVDSDLRSLVNRLGSIKLNKHKLKNYFLWQYDDEPVDNETFYVGTSKLLPGQTACFQNGKLRFVSEKPPLFQEDNTAANNFKHYFLQAVRSRTPDLPVAANLSGGLDSSSVVAMLCETAGNKPLAVYYNANVAAANERPYAEEVAKKFGLPLRSAQSPPDLYSSLVEITKLISQPDPGILPSFIHQQIFAKVGENDLKVVFSGHGGDNVTGYGFDYLDELVTNNEWQLLKSAIANYQKLRKNNASPIDRQLFAGHLKKAVRRREFVTAAHLFIRATLMFKVNFLSRFSERENAPPVAYEHFESTILRKKVKSAVSAEFQQFDVTGVFGELAKSAKGYAEFNFINLAISGNEVLSLLGHGMDQVVSFPFFDKKLMASQINVPAKERFGNGYTRGVIREALAGVLPEKVRHRTSKADFTTYAHACFTALHSNFRRNFGPSHQVWDFVDAATFEQLVEIVLDNALPPGKKVSYTWLAMRVINFGIWLDNQQLNNEE